MQKLSQLKTLGIFDCDGFSMAHRRRLMKKLPSLDLYEFEYDDYDVYDDYESDDYSS